jgi:hypothetical protein
MLAMPSAFGTKPTMNNEFKSLSLFVISLIACILGSIPLAQAANRETALSNSIALDFKLGAEGKPQNIEANEFQPENDDVNVLKVPDQGPEPPVGRSKQNQASENLAELPPPPLVEPTREAIAPIRESSPPAPLTPPEFVESRQSDESTQPDQPSAETLAMLPTQAETSQHNAQQLSRSPAAQLTDGILDFSLSGDNYLSQASSEGRSLPSESSSASSQTEHTAEDLPSLPPELESLFDGGVNSLVARSVGSAEGTRTPDGRQTSAYLGHVDPGNGAWNLGTFSYQHGATSPQEADERQLNRLRKQTQLLVQQADETGIELDLEATLNGIDLANQSPEAALSIGGYIDRLKQAYDMGFKDSEAVLWARTRAFLDPDTQRWNAPGLGNTIDSISADQERRQRAIALAIAAQPRVSTTDEPLQFAKSSDIDASRQSSPDSPNNESGHETIIDQILSLDLF